MRYAEDINMAIYFAPKEVGAGERIGTGLGTGLSQGLQALAQQKMQQMQQRKSLDALKAAGLTDQDAALISQYSPEIQAKLLGNLWQRGPGMPFSQSGDMAQQLQQGLAPQQTFPDMQEVLSRGETGGQVAPLQQQQMQNSFYSLPLKERREQEKLDLKRRQVASQEEASRFKATAAERKDIIDKARAARQDLKDLDRMEELEKEGKLDTPGYTEFLKRSGLDIPALMNPGSEEFIKTSANFMRNAKTYLGSRISNYELEQFLKTIPSLSQSPQGRKRVISNLKYVARSALEYNNALKEVLAKNKGVPPYDLPEQIDDRIESKLDKLSQKFKEDLARPVPKGQNKLITALQSIAGSTIGPVAGGLAGGLVGGPVGALGGAALGGGAGKLISKLF